MPLWDMTPGDNPNAAGIWTFGHEGSDGSTGVTMDSNGNVTFAGNLTVGGAVVAGSGLAVPNPYGIQAAVGPYDAGSDFPLGSGNLLLNLLALPAGTYTRIGAWVTTAGATSGGSNRLVLYSEAGLLLDQSVDATAALSAGAGAAEVALLSGGYVHAGGNVYLGALTHYASLPRLAGASAIGNVPTLNGHRPAIFYSGQTSPPASVDPAAGNANSAAYFVYLR